jgi:Peptidase family M48
MLKPFFARSVKFSETERELDPEREPLLFAFVDGVCSSVGSPRPVRVLVDCQVNAGARLEGGALSVIGGELVLKIGLPLVAGLTLKQFAGVLAHEFGHFSQAAGMRLGQLIRRVNMWFARVVYERDHWDQKLAEWSSSGDGYAMALAIVIRIAVWVARRVLWVLMYTGHAVSGILSRQMEFDADRYEARMVGSRVFTQTCWQLQVLNLAYQGAFADMRSSWQQKRMPDSLPKLVLANVPQLPKELLTIHRKAMSESKTGIFDTHPCDRDRIAHAKAEVPGEGIFTLDGPATDVFRDFDSLSRAATLDFYKENLGPEITKEQLFPVSELVESQTVAQEGEVACRRFFLDSPNYTKKLPLPWDAPKAPTDPPAAKRALVSARKTMEATRDGFLKATKAWEEASTSWVNAEAGMLLAKTDCKFKPKEFGLTSTKLKDAEQSRDAAEAETNEQLAAMLPFSEAAARRLVQALAILKVDTVAKKVPDGFARRDESLTLYTCVAHLGANVMPALAPVIHTHRVVATLLQYFHKGNNEKNAALINAILRAVAKLRDALEEFRWKLGDTIYYPFEHATEDITLGRFALPPILPDKEDIGGIVGAAETAIERVVNLYARALGRLTVSAEEVERALGLEPIETKPAEEPEA